MITTATRNVYTKYLPQTVQTTFSSLFQPGTLGKGLDEQLARFVAEHTDTKLIIIDTLQKVREVSGDNYSYANDYQIMARLKSFADAHGLCILLVHHTRKQTADDKFDMISGTSGLLRCGGRSVPSSERKTDWQCSKFGSIGQRSARPKAISYPQHRNIIWELQRAETELWKEPPEPFWIRLPNLL